MTGYYVSIRGIQARRCNYTIYIPHLTTYTRVGDSNEFSSMPTIQQIRKQVNTKIWIELRLLCTRKNQQASVPYSVAQYSSWMDSSNNGEGFVAEKPGRCT